MRGCVGGVVVELPELEADMLPEYEFDYRQARANRFAQDMPAGSANDCGQSHDQLRMDLIFIHGAPGTGKSSLAWALQAKFQSPCFEFGWIPEFRVKRNSTISYEEEEGLAFENLTLVVKNYVRHGFDNIIITDLRDHIVQRLAVEFEGYAYILVSLWMDDEEALKSRVLDASRSSGYRDWQAAVTLNKDIVSRPLMRNEVRFNSAQNSVEQLVAEVGKLLAEENRVERAQRGDRQKFESAMAKVAKIEAEAHDRL